MRVNTAIVLCGGLGTRLRSVVSDLPKSMADIQGSPFLEYLLRYWIDQGIQRFILCVGYKADSIIDYFGGVFEDAEILYSVEKKALGTGGALLKAINQFDLIDPIILINGDTFFAVDLNKLDGFAIEQRADCCFSLFQSSDGANRYMPIAIKDDGSLFIKSEEARGNQMGLLNEAKEPISDLEIKVVLNLYNGGVYWIRPNALDSYLNQHSEHLSLENELIPSCIIAGKRFYGVTFSGLFIDIGVPDDYFRARKINFGKK